MKASNIFVGINGATLALTKGRAVAVFPPQKGGDAVSYALMESGKLARIAGARWNGVGVPRYLKENGFELVDLQVNPGADLAVRLADMLDVQEGLKLVEAASETKATELQRDFARQSCTFVPFDETKASSAVKIEAPGYSRTVSFDLVEGFSSGAVRIDYVPGSNLGFDLAMSAGWLVGPTGDAAAMPRNTEYGGTVEKAVYVICNCGLGTLVGERNLVADARNAAFPRGLMKFALENGDVVRVGVDGGDDLRVAYFRGEEIQYIRSGMYEVRLGDVIGAIAAVIVRVREKDAAKTKKAMKKAA